MEYRKAYAILRRTLARSSFVFRSKEKTLAGDVALSWRRGASVSEAYCWFPWMDATTRHVPNTRTMVCRICARRVSHASVSCRNCLAYQEFQDTAAECDSYDCRRVRAFILSSRRQEDSLEAQQAISFIECDETTQCIAGEM
jgi:hypothetical protein